MATVTGLTAERMIAMENQTVIDGNVVGDNLILQTRDGTNIDTGNVRGPMGPGGSGFQICTSTTRPALLLADEGKAIYETDTDLYRIWTGTRWKLQEQIICTSTTRPASLGTADEGVYIYETNTDLQYVWTGTRWKIQERIICTSSTRPTLVTADEGVTIYETDTNLEYVWKGSVWFLTTPPIPQIFVFGFEPLSTTASLSGTISAGTPTYDYRVLVNLTFRYWHPSGGVLEAVRVIGLLSGPGDWETQGVTYIANAEHHAAGQSYSRDMNAGQAATFPIHAYTLTNGGGVRGGVAAVTIVPR